MNDRVRRDGSRFGTRIIRAGGRVKWLGRWYRIDDSPARLSVQEYEQLDDKIRPQQENAPRYDGRLDGLGGLFYNYGPTQAFPDHVYLHSFGDEWPGPHCIAGVFCWDTFTAEAVE